MKRTCYLYLLLVFALLINCSPDNNGIDDDLIVPDEIEEEALIGFNMRWIDTPELDTKLLKYIDSLKPNLMRYPGGTLAHKWNWETGKSTPNWPSHTVHLIDDVKKLSDGANTEIIFVLDIVNSSIENQLEMLLAANVPVKYIEMGNELYADHYETIFPNGKSYADTINKWTPVLKQQYPNAKIGVSMIGRTAGNDRKNNWNNEIHTNLNVAIDAYIYHIYVSDDETVLSRINRFEEQFIENSGKETWITEYGAHSHSIGQTNEISDYVESIATIALSHCLISASGNFSKITNDIEYTEEGLLYLKRNNPLVN